MIAQISLLLFWFFSFATFTAADEQVPPVVLADFEDYIPCSQCGDNLGYRKNDTALAARIPDGALGSNYSAQFMFNAQQRDLYFQGNVRRKLLATGSAEYLERGPNALSFWVKVPADSPLLDGLRFNVWTYHWRPGDMQVGGGNNNSLTTDSNMHGYSDFVLRHNAAERWVQVVLATSAFSQARNYYHFYAGAANTDDLDFFASLRQLQIRISPPEEQSVLLQLDEMKLIHVPPTARFEQNFVRDQVAAGSGDYRMPVTLHNPTDKERRYRVFISSNLGVARDRLNLYFGLSDALAPMQRLQVVAGSDGGLGVATLFDSHGRPVAGAGKEIHIAAGESWQGDLVHRIKPEMLGEEVSIVHAEISVSGRRDTLTTSVIVWDPDDPGQGTAAYIRTRGSNADAATHRPPPGFPKQVRPDAGWRSEDIPLDQVGANIVTVLKLR